MSDIKNKLIKIAYENPELRGELLPVIVEMSKMASNDGPYDNVNFMRSLDIASEVGRKFKVMVPVEAAQEFIRAHNWEEAARDYDSNASHGEDDEDDSYSDRRQAQVCSSNFRHHLQKAEDIIKNYGIPSNTKVTQDTLNKIYKDIITEHYKE